MIQRLKGVKKIASGYTGGIVSGVPICRKVCSWRAGHAEIVQVTFDSDIISCHDLITVFMISNDSTQLNRQVADSGT